MCEWIFEVAGDVKKKDHQPEGEDSSSHQQAGEDIALHTLGSGHRDSTASGSSCGVRGDEVAQPQSRGDENNLTEEVEVTADEQTCDQMQKDNTLQDSV